MSNTSSPQEGPNMDLNLQYKFQQELIRASKAKEKDERLEKPDVEFVTDEEYRAECSVLPKSFMENPDFEALIPDDFMLDWANGNRCCIFALPFTGDFSNKESMFAGGSWDNFIDNKRFICAMYAYDSGLSERFVGDVPGYYHNLLPKILRKDVSKGGCTFRIDYKKPRELNNEDDRREFIKQCQKAWDNLRAFFGEGFGADTGEGPTLH